MRKKVAFFVSHAHRNQALVDDFLARLHDVLAPSKRHDYSLWHDSALQVGEDWQAQLDTAIARCDFGLLLVSPAFLASRYITEQELPAFTQGRKPVIPVMLQPIDLALHDLKGLDGRQIFRLEHPAFSSPRAYGECRGRRRDSFVLALFQAIEARLAQP